MCLFVDDARSKRFIKYYTKEKPTKQIIAYKVLTIGPNGIKLISPYRNYEYTPGIINSNKLPYTQRPIAEIHEGIHVYLSKKDAETNHEDDIDVVVPVTCLISDFMGRDSFDEAAFTKVRLLKSDYKKVLAAIAEMYEQGD